MALRTPKAGRFVVTADRIGGRIMLEKGESAGDAWSLGNGTPDLSAANRFPALKQSLKGGYPHTVLDRIV